MSADFKFKVKVFESQKPKKIPKPLSEELKKARLGAKSLARMKKESVDCPVIGQEVGFLVCFSCPSFVRRVMGEVDCAGRESPPKEWLLS